MACVLSVVVSTNLPIADCAHSSLVFDRLHGSLRSGRSSTIVTPKSMDGSMAGAISRQTRRVWNH